MRINIAERLKPYSHVPGSYCILPGSRFRLQIFPARLRIDDMTGQSPVLFADISIQVLGPLKNFTILQDLEKGCLSVWGQTQTGFMRYKIYAEKSSHKVGIAIEKAPEEGLIFNGLKKLPGQKISILRNNIELKECEQNLLLPTDRLSLGSHKAQDWSLIHRRLNMGEIMPIWLKLGQLVPQPSKASLEGTACLLEKCRQAIESKTTLAIMPAFHHLFLAGFEGMLSPRLQDDDYQGFNIQPVSLQNPLSPLILLTEGAFLIRSLFVELKDHLIKILPALPPEFHCGRLIGFRCAKLGSLDIEWSKKTIRRMIFHAHENGEINFEFTNVKSYRLRKDKSDRGERRSSDQSLKIQSNSHYLLDNFKR